MSTRLIYEVQKDNKYNNYKLVCKGIEGGDSAEEATFAEHMRQFVQQFLDQFQAVMANWYESGVPADFLHRNEDYPEAVAEDAEIAKKEQKDK